MPTLETFSYFIIILGGFGVVWAYRKLTKAEEKISDFEYLAFSAIWGAISLALFTLPPVLMGKIGELAGLISSNPYAAGPSIFIFGTFVGWLGYKIIPRFKSFWQNLKPRLPKWVIEFLDFLA